MNKLLITGFAAVMTLGSIAASAAELTPDERSELRQRADEWQRMRAQNPRAGQEGMQLDRPQGDVKMGKPRGEVKATPKGTKKSKVKKKLKSAGAKAKSKTASTKAKVTRTAKDMPGAMVRKDR